MEIASGLLNQKYRLFMNKEGFICNYSVVTECGVFFYTNKKYKIGDVLKGFDSPKHK